MKDIVSGYYDSPIGTIRICGSDAGITAIDFTDQSEETPYPLPVCIQTAIQQIQEYFENKRQAFDLKLCIHGTDFQEKVWQEVHKIPFGETSSYSQLASKLNNPGAVRAIGSTNGRNKIALVIPCHRVNGKNGHLTGYAWGLWRKQWLLHHEQSLIPKSQLNLFS